MRASATGHSRESIPVGMRLLLATGFLLAVASTVLLVIAEDARTLRLAVVIGLWAALAAAFGLARFRRDAKISLLRQDEIKRTYELELQREVAARREFETSFAEKARGHLQAQYSDELVALREQIERLTQTLTGLLDGDLLVERLTLSAESTRVRLLGDRRGERGIAGPAQMRHSQPMGPELRLPPGPAMRAADPPPAWAAAARTSYDPDAGAITEQIPRILVEDEVAAEGERQVPVGDDLDPSDSDVVADARPAEPAVTGADAPDVDGLGAAPTESVVAGARGLDPGDVAAETPDALVAAALVAEPQVLADRPDAPATDWTWRHRATAPAPPPLPQPEPTDEPIDRAPEAEPEPESEPVPEPVPALPVNDVDLAEGGSGHRRGVSVAELLAAYRGRGEVGRHRRRRSAD